MITARTKAGAIAKGETYEDLVRALYEMSKGWHTSEQQYMRRVATRARLWNGSKIRRGTAEKFIKDLAAAGLITRITGNNEGVI